MDPFALHILSFADEITCECLECGRCAGDAPRPQPTVRYIRGSGFGLGQLTLIVLPYSLPTQLRTLCRASTGALRCLPFRVFPHVCGRVLVHVKVPKVGGNHRVASAVISMGLCLISATVDHHSCRVPAHAASPCCSAHSSTFMSQRLICIGRQSQMLRLSRRCAGLFGRAASAVGSGLYSVLSTVGEQTRLFLAHNVSSLAARPTIAHFFPGLGRPGAHRGVYGTGAKPLFSSIDLSRSRWTPP